MSDKLFLPTSVAGVSPKPITMEIPRVESPGDVVIGIEDYKGRFYPIFPLLNTGHQYNVINADPVYSTLMYASNHFKSFIGGTSADIPGVGSIQVTDLVTISFKILLRAVPI